MYLQTNRLLLKNYVPTDGNDYHQLRSCNEVWKYSTTLPNTDIAFIKSQLNELIENQFTNDTGFCALIEKASGKYIGEAGILSINHNVNRCVIGYNLLPAFWNKGYATEIAKALLAYAFTNLHLERVEALAMEKNTASCHVLEKSGLKREGIMRHFTIVDGEYSNVCYYGIIQSDFEFINNKKEI